MEPEKDGCFWASVVITFGAVFCWALSVTIHVGDAWVPWAAVTVSVLAIGGMSTRFALKNRGVVWTEEMKEAQRRRYRRLFLEMLWWSPLTLGLWPSMQLERAGIIPEWVGGVLVVLLIAAVFVLRFVIRSSKVWKDVS